MKIGWNSTKQSSTAKSMRLLPIAIWQVTPIWARQPGMKRSNKLAMTASDRESKRRGSLLGFGSWAGDRSIEGRLATESYSCRAEVCRVVDLYGQKERYFNPGCACRSVPSTVFSISSAMH